MLWWNLDSLWTDWHTWLPLIAGLVSAVLILLVGRSLSRIRGSVPATGPVEEAPDPFETGSATERRGAARRGGRHVRVYVSDAAAEASPTEGWVLDRSVGGIHLSLNHPVAPGTLLTIRACNAPETIPWTQVRVLRCQ